MATSDSDVETIDEAQDDNLGHETPYLQNFHVSSGKGAGSVSGPPSDGSLSAASHYALHTAYTDLKSRYQVVENRNQKLVKKCRQLHKQQGEMQNSAQNVVEKSSSSPPRPVPAGRGDVSHPGYQVPGQQMTSPFGNRLPAEHKVALVSPPSGQPLTLARSISSGRALDGNETLNVLVNQLQMENFKLREAIRNLSQQLNNQQDENKKVWQRIKINEEQLQIESIKSLDYEKKWRQREETIDQLKDWKKDAEIYVQRQWGDDLSSRIRNMSGSSSGSDESRIMDMESLKEDLRQSKQEIASLKGQLEKQNKQMQKLVEMERRKTRKIYKQKDSDPSNKKLVQCTDDVIQQGQGAHLDSHLNNSSGSAGHKINSNHSTEPDLLVGVPLKGGTSMSYVEENETHNNDIVKTMARPRDVINLSPPSYDACVCHRQDSRQDGRLQARSPTTSHEGSSRIQKVVQNQQDEFDDNADEKNDLQVYLPPKSYDNARQNVNMLTETSAVNMPAGAAGKAVNSDNNNPLLHHKPVAPPRNIYRTTLETDNKPNLESEICFPPSKDSPPYDQQLYGNLPQGGVDQQLYVNLPQGGVDSRECPICNVNFPMETPMEEFQLHVMDCMPDVNLPVLGLRSPQQAYDSNNDHVCPVCNMTFSLNTLSVSDFTRHVNDHFDDEDIVHQFEVLNTSS